MRIPASLLLAFLLFVYPSSSAVLLIVTVIDKKSAQPVKDLKAGDFEVLDDKKPRDVAAVEYRTAPVDAMLLVDTSLAGESVRPAAAGLIEQLGEKEQMAVVAFAASADLVQDFTSSKQLLLRSLDGVKYGNQPQVRDALFAAIDGGFSSTIYRRVILLLTSGYSGGSGVSDRSVIRLARKNGVSIYPIYLAGSSRSLFEDLAEKTGGALFNLREMAKVSSETIGARVFEVVRSHYLVTIEGNFPPGENLEVKLKRSGKYFVSASVTE